MPGARRACHPSIPLLLAHMLIASALSQCRLLMVYHKAALAATRDFWKLLLREEVNLVALAHSFRRIDEMESMAEKTYRWAGGLRPDCPPAACICWVLRICKSGASAGAGACAACGLRPA